MLTNRENHLIVLIGFGCINMLMMVSARSGDVIGTAGDSTKYTQPDDIDFKEDNDAPGNGDRCFHIVRHANGLCTDPGKCPEVIRDFQKGIQPQICSYEGTRPIVCCPLSETFTTTSTTNVPYFPPIAATTSARISEIKCEEYSKLGIERNIVGAFSVGERINNTVEKAKCTLSGGDGFIVGGTVTKVGEYPHMAVIGWQNIDGSVDWNCGASLISYQFVLTAAHCTSWRSKKPNIVRLGEQNLKVDDDNASIQDFGIQTIIRHPDYKVSSKYFDIALFRLDRRVFITDEVRPACLWQTHDIGYGSAIATGWGLTRDRGQPSNDLLKVSLKFIANQRCNGFFQRFNALKNGIIDSQLCAGDDVEERDTCNGDSGKEIASDWRSSMKSMISLFFFFSSKKGGPLQLLTPPCTHHVVGITSFGIGMHSLRNCFSFYLILIFCLQAVGMDMGSTRELQRS